ncbi:MAG: sugar transferase [Clostridia bacterium]|nr:sugar transferase [Clostridia bacterium]
MYRYFFKRCLDILLSLIGIIVLAIPMIIIAIAVKCDSKGPAIFSQIRSGRNGKPFRLFKFRSMRIDAPSDVATRDLQGNNITKVGHFLRKTSLDELPQMFCILIGTMSIIGPRPVVLKEEELLNYRKQFGADKVRPGLTGLAQVQARDNLTDMHLKAEIDGIYANKITFWGDIKIFVKTIFKVLKQDDVAEGGEEVQKEILINEEDEKMIAELERKAEAEGVAALETASSNLELTEMLSEAQKQAQTAEETA